MQRGCLWLILLLAVGPAVGQESKPRTIDLGGPRKAQAVLTADDDGYTIRLRMLPIHVFDAATNAKLNRERAKAYALHALARHLTEAKEGFVTVSGTRITATGTDDPYYTLTLRVPRGGIAWAASPAKPSAGAVEPVDQPATLATSALFTRKQDYLLTIQVLATAYRAEVRSADRQAATGEADAGQFDAAAARITRQARTNFDRLRAAIKADLLLSSILRESESLTETLDREQAALDRELRRVVLSRAKAAEPKEAPR